jgi:hypothetical protein
MPYSYNTGTKNTTTSINTDGLTLYGPDSALRLDFYNHFISVKLFPIKPEDKRTPKSVYDYSRRISLSLAREDAMYLSWFLENDIIPKSLKGEPAEIGIVSAKANLFIISNGIKETGSLNPVIYLHKGLNEKLIPTESMTFRFRTTKVVLEYDPTTGSSKARDDNRIGLIILQKFFEACGPLSGAGIHAIKYIDRYRRANAVNFMRAASLKGGYADYAKANYVDSGRVQGELNFNNEGAIPGDDVIVPDDEAPIASAASLDDINALM